RGEPAASPLLASLLSDPDATIASEAAAALGRIGGAAAVAALSTARDGAPAAVKPAVQESLLKCAERLRANNDSPGAADIYRGLFNARFPVQIRCAAWRGLA